MLNAAVFVLFQEINSSTVEFSTFKVLKLKMHLYWSKNAFVNVFAPSYLRISFSHLLHCVFVLVNWREGQKFIPF